jgi:hypothetical protein
MKHRLILIALAVFSLVVLAACGDFTLLSPTFVQTTTVIQTGATKDTSTLPAVPVPGCPIDSVEVSGEGKMAAKDTQRMDATPKYFGRELSKDCAESLPKKWSELTPTVCRFISGTSTHNPTLEALKVGRCEIMFSQGGFKLDEPFVVTVE